MAHEKVFDQVAEGISKIASNIKVGPGMDSSSEMGPLVSDEQFKKVSGYIESGKSEGGEIIAGGKYDNSSGGHFVHPTVFAKTDKDMSIVKEEIFGPVLCAQPFSDQDLDKIAEVANNTTFGLAASVWSQNISTAHKLAAKIRAGTVWVNCHNIFDASLPFGGYKESGWGREMGHEVLKNYTELKAVTVNL
jgi:phenylacetaldehyde dehydrogenase